LNEPIPKIDRQIARRYSPHTCGYDYKRKKHLPTIRIVPDNLWEEIKVLLPPEKQNRTIGRPVIPFRKVLDGMALFTF
jgi:hypothetical protein